MDPQRRPSWLPFFPVECAVAAHSRPTLKRMQNPVTTTERLPKGMGFALQPSALTSFLASENIVLEWSLHRNRTGAFFECFFWPPNPNVSNERLYFRASALPAASVSDAKVYLESEVMAALRIWLRDLLSEPSHSTRRREKQLFSREFKASKHAV